MPEAMAETGCSKRTIERLAAARQIERRLRPQAGSPAIAVYNPEDVARIAVARRPAATAFVVPASTTGNGNGHGLTYPKHADGLSFDTLAGDPIRQLAAVILKALQSPPSPPVAESVAERPWVDVPTAAALLGRSQAYVRRQITAGRLHAERDRCLLVRRQDLEAL
jgi:hypothetical protein